MKTTAITKLFLVLSILLWGSNMAWAEGEIEIKSGNTLGAADNSTGWWSAFSEYVTIPANKTFTIEFTNNHITDEQITSTSTAWDNQFNWFVVFANTLDRGAQGYAEYFVLRADNYGWGANYDPSHIWSTYNWSSFKNDMQGANVKLTIEREGATIKYRAVTTTTGSVTYEEDYRAYNIGDGTQDIRIFFTVNHSHLTFSQDYAITDTETTTGHTIVGNRDNTTLYWNQFSDYYTIAANGTLNIQFKNYTSKVGNYANWLAAVTNDVRRGGEGYTEYVVLRADNYAWQTGTYVNDEKIYDKNTGPEKDPVGEAHGVTHNWYTSLEDWYDWTHFGDDMDGSVVNMQVSRSSATVTIRADITTTSGATYYEQFVLNCGDGTQPIRFFLTTDHGHLDIDNAKTNTGYFNTAKVSAYKWSTYCSSHALDFTSVDDLEAFMITGNNGSSVTLSKVEGTIPANVGLLLKGTANKYYDIPVVASSDTDHSANKLVACHDWDHEVFAEANKTTYVLSVNGETAEFQKVIKVKNDETANHSAIVDRGKAYLQFDGNVPAPSLQFDFDFSTPTAIENLTPALSKGNGAVYNLNGQRVAQPKKGLYIVNGKKIIK